MGRPAADLVRHPYPKKSLVNRGTTEASQGQGDGSMVLWGSSVILTCCSSSSALQLPYRSQLPVLANLADGYMTKARMEVPRLRSSSRFTLSATPAAGPADGSRVGLRKFPTDR